MLDIREHDQTEAAPSELELVQRFMNLHEHAPGTNESRPPTREMVRTFLVERALLDEGATFSRSDHETALALHRALHAKVRANAGEQDVSEADVAAIDDVARRAGLYPRFGAGGPTLAPAVGGVRGALGRLVAVAFLADLTGSWVHLKECAGANCFAVFFDRSKNHSGRWCSMSGCGNRAKVRAWRERRRSDDA